jgi:hypothetical protein
MNASRRKAIAESILHVVVLSVLTVLTKPYSDLNDV